LVIGRWLAGTNGKIYPYPHDCELYYFRHVALHSRHISSHLQHIAPHLLVAAIHFCEFAVDVVIDFHLMASFDPGDTRGRSGLIGRGGDHTVSVLSLLIEEGDFIMV
jgi:hypothetical protein